MQVTLLGSGGFMPTDSRETACALVREGGEGLLIDAGTGVRRLVTAPELVEGVERLHVVLTHFHLDHVIGLFYLPDVQVPAELWAAGEALEQTPSAALVERLLSSPFAPDFGRKLAAVHELRADGAELGGFHLDVRIQRMHANATLAVKVDGELVSCTDTAYDEENVEFARGARLLLHEAFYPADSTDDPGHTAAGEAGRLAAAAGVERLVLIHVNPVLDDEAELLRCARRHFAATEVGRDGLVV